MEGNFYECIIRRKSIKSDFIAFEYSSCEIERGSITISVDIDCSINGEADIVLLYLIDDGDGRLYIDKTSSGRFLGGRVVGYTSYNLGIIVFDLSFLEKMQLGFGNIEINFYIKG